MKAGRLFLPVLPILVDFTSVPIQPNMLSCLCRHTAGFNFSASFSVSCNTWLSASQWNESGSDVWPQNSTPISTSARPHTHFSFLDRKGHPGGLGSYLWMVVVLKIHMQILKNILLSWIACSGRSLWRKTHKQPHREMYVERNQYGSSSPSQASRWLQLQLISDCNLTRLLSQNLLAKLLSNCWYAATTK